MWKLALATLVVLALAGGILISTANAAVPGDLLYGVDRGIEALRLSLTKDAQSADQLQQQNALERLEEIQNLALSGGDEAVISQAIAQVSFGDNSQAPANQEIAQQDDDDGDGDDGEDGEEKEGNQGIYCNGGAEKNHPSGEKLAEEFGVEYDEIMDWFCQGYGFGEISLAYYISEKSGVSVDEIFAKRAEGMGWGQIMKEYDLKGKSQDKGKPEDKGKGKPEDKGKPDDKEKP